MHLRQIAKHRKVEIPRLGPLALTIRKH